MKEIGGYFQLEEYEGSEYHSEAIALDSGRSCLKYLIASKNISKIYLPFFLCDSIKNACREMVCEYEEYSITDFWNLDFNKKLNPDQYLYIVNYYGQLSIENILYLKNTHKNIIVDNVHSFFSKPCPDVDTIYSCRKYFGVPDGAYLYTKFTTKENIELGKSAESMSHILGRYEISAKEFFEIYKEHEKGFENKPVKGMSKLTHNLLKPINYEKVKNTRTHNFESLHKSLQEINQLKLNIPSGAFAYPIMLNNAEIIKKKLIEKKIYIPTLWPEVIENIYAKNILPLPVDQRYNEEDMRYMAEIIIKISKGV